MNGVLLRHQQPGGLGRAPRKPMPRGASRLVAKEPLSVRLPKADFSFLKYLAWPLLLAVLGYGAYRGAEYILPYADRPIAKVSVEGDLSYISQRAVQQRISPYLAASFFTIDLAGMRGQLEQMPWIAHAEVRRVWPDQVVIRLDEQLPIARWGDEALLNNQGQAFTPKELANYEHLPRLHGPQRAQQQVMQQYQLLSQLLRPWVLHRPPGNERSRRLGADHGPGRRDPDRARPRGRQDSPLRKHLRQGSQRSDFEHCADRPALPQRPRRCVARAGHARDGGHGQRRAVS